MSLDTGSLVSHYRIVRRLGAGGMGEVFLAQDLRLDRQVAIKFLKEPGDERSHKRIVQEARAAASLDHPFICAVYEVGTDPAEGDFIVMQFVEGEPLSVRLQRHRLPPAEAIALCRRIAEALKAAHAQGIVHRDLKPQNVIITPTGEPKLLDFGIAKRILSAEAAAEADTTSQVTNPDAQVGTPAYMSPEQVRSHPADFRSDLFALGCVFYECLTGRRAFNGPTTADVLGQVLHVEPPPPSTIVPELGTMYDPICARLLKKDPRERFQSADEVLGALYALTTAASPSATTATAVKRTSTLTLPLPVTGWGKIAAAATAVVVVGSAIVTWQLSRSAHLPDPPATAKQWYERGLDALRQGTFVAARSELTEAVRQFPEYVQARSRLAEVHSELDDEGAAKTELLKVNELVPDQTRLQKEDGLRLDAVRAAVLRDYKKSAEAYRRIADINPTDPRAWLDVGRAEEGRNETGAAREAYKKALSFDTDYAAAHLRLGSLAGTPIADATRELDKAIGIYHTATNPEGEAEAILREGVALNAAGQRAAARVSLERVLAMTTDDRYLWQRVRAQFELAAVTASEGQFAEAISGARSAIEAAQTGGLHATAANGLVDLAGALAYANKKTEADAELTKAIELASSHGAKRTEMRARLQQAGLYVSMGKPQEALVAATAALPFFADGRYPRNEAQAKRILALANVRLGRYDEARKLTDEVIKLADSMQDRGLAASVLDDTYSLLVDQGRLADALSNKERVESIHRDLSDYAHLAFDLTDRSELLINLGRGADAAKLFEEIEQRAAEKNQVFVSRLKRVALLRGLHAAVEGRFSDAVKFSDAVGTGTTSPPTSAELLATVLREYARSASGQSRVPTGTIVGWLEFARTPVFRRELSYWAGLTLMARHETKAAKALGVEGYSSAGADGNVELRWRLEAIAAASDTGAADSASIAAHARDDIRKLTSTLGAYASSYFSRSDFKVLLVKLQIQPQAAQR